MKLETWARSDIGLIRKSNQDALGVYPEVGVFILADGMGGHAAGEVASRMAVEAIYDELQQNGRRNAPASSLSMRVARLFGRSAVQPHTEATLRAAFQHANQVIAQAGVDRSDGAAERRMGSTAVVLVIAPNDARALWAHVGDSRLYRLRVGELALLTADHTLPGDQYRGEAVIPTDLPHTNVLLQALGTQPDVDVAIGAADTEAGDLFLLCSDGISGQLNAAVIQQQLTATDDLQQAGEALIRLSLQAGGRDNASAVLVRIVEG